MKNQFKSPTVVARKLENLFGNSRTRLLSEGQLYTQGRDGGGERDNRTGVSRGER